MRIKNRESLFQKLRLVLLLGPALMLIFVLYFGGLLFAGLQSLGVFPAAGMSTFSLNAYRALLSRPDFTQSLWLTCWVSLVSTALSSVLSLMTALLLRAVVRHTSRGHRLLAFLYQLNLPVPHSVGAVGILLLFSQSGLLARLAYVFGIISSPADFPALLFDPLGIGIILEYVWKAAVFMGVILFAALSSVAEDYEATASTLGADSWQRFWYVILPLLRPSLVSSSVLVFAFTFGSYEVAYLLGQRSISLLPVLAYREYSRVDLAARPEAMAISMVIAMLISVLAGVYMHLTRERI